MKKNHTNSNVFHTPFFAKCLGFIVITLAISFFGATTANVQSRPSENKAKLFDLTGSLKNDSSVSIAGVREQEVKINFDQINFDAAQELNFPLLDGKSYRAIRHTTEGFERFALDEFTWRGKISGDDNFSGDVILTVKGLSLSALIYSPNAVYEIIPQENFRHILVEIDQSRFPSCGGTPPVPERETLKPGKLEPIPNSSIFSEPSNIVDDGSLIDVMIVYTPQVRAAFGGASQTQASIQQAIAETNTAYINSNINPRVRLVHTMEVNYTETGVLQNALNWVRADSTVATARNTFKADLVSIVSNDSDACGWAPLMTTVSTSFAPNAFSSIARICLTGNFTTAHEFGHNQGAHHNPEDAGGAVAYPYAYGHYNNSGGFFTTVMSYSTFCGGCARAPVFSNPSRTYNGFPTGITNQRENFRVLNNTALTVSQFRDSGGGNCTYSLDPPSRNFTAAGGSNSVIVNTQAGCAWTTTVNAPTLSEILTSSLPQDMFPFMKDAAAQAAPEVLFLNSTPITIFDRTSNSNPPGTASLYPSTINVSGMTGTITQVDAALNNLSHTYPDDIDVILVGPGGQRAILMSDAGGNPDLSGVNLTFNQNAASQLPDSTQISTGTYRPTNFNGNTTLEPGGVDNFPSPGPGQAVHPLDLSVFNGTNPNGTWRIYVVDDENVDSGNIATGWALGITTSGGGTSWITITSGSSGTGTGTINYNVAANSGQNQRPGSIVVNGQATHNITQEGSGTNPCNQSTPIAFGQTINGALTTSDCLVSNAFYTDKYSFSGVAGQQIAITMNSTAVDAYLLLYTSSGQFLSADDNGGGGTNARILPGSGNYILPSTGSYIIEASTAPSFQTGAYSVSLISATPPPPPSGNKAFDFDGDSKTDIGIFRPSNGQWWINRSLTNQTVTSQFGIASDKIVPADFTGDGKTDIAFWRPATGEWFILRSENSTFYAFPFGSNNDIPAPGDFDGDGKADAAVFRPSNSTWYIQRSSGGVTIQQFGLLGDVPVTADYDGDGKSDIAIYRPSVGEWWILRSAAGLIAYQFGNSGDKTVQGDYTGDGKADVAVWRPSNGFWYILRSENNSFFAFPFGSPGDLAVPGDYDGDGKSDGAVFRPSNSTWYLQRTTGGFTAIAFGITGDQPIPNAFVR